MKQVISVLTYDDENVETNGNITATIATPTANEYVRSTTHNYASVTVKDNEPELSISTTQTTVEEGNPINYTITASVEPTIAILVQIGVTQTENFWNLLNQTD